MTVNLPDTRPACSKEGHGFMTLRSFNVQTYEQLWTGPWYDCIPHRERAAVPQQPHEHVRRDEGVRRVHQAAHLTITTP